MSRMTEIISQGGKGLCVTDMKVVSRSELSKLFLRHCHVEKDVKQHGAFSLVVDTDVIMWVSQPMICPWAKGDMRGTERCCRNHLCFFASLLHRATRQEGTGHQYAHPL